MGGEEARFESGCRSGACRLLKVENVPIGKIEVMQFREIMQLGGGGGETAFDFTLDIAAELNVS